MEPIVEVFRRTGKTVPVFADKHFSYSWSKAKQMYGWSRELKFPLMAGSSIPLTVRTPLLEIPYEAHVESAVALGYGELDAYGFHTLEALQCMIERRKGGETGIRAVEWIEGDAVWQWRDGEGRWSIPLLNAALACDSSTKSGRMEDHVKSPALSFCNIWTGRERWPTCSTDTSAPGVLRLRSKAEPNLSPRFLNRVTRPEAGPFPISTRLCIAWKKCS